MQKDKETEILNGNSVSVFVVILIEFDKSETSRLVKEIHKNVFFMLCQGSFAFLQCFQYKNTLTGTVNYRRPAIKVSLTPPNLRGG